ncbi:MAG: hypothetical protein ABSE49_28025 [Polyangiaceae bacterium]|jgi:hypothetical protein
MTPAERLSVLLMQAGFAAAALGLTGLTRVLEALEVSSDEAKLGWLDAKGGPVAHAHAYLKKTGRIGVAPRRPDLVRWLATLFGERDPNLETLVSKACLMLTFARAELVIGAPTGDPHEVRQRMQKKLLAVFNRSDADPHHKVAALLRGWGLSEEDARAAVKGIA